MKAYSLLEDRDSTDLAARYMWNLALVAAFQPVLHFVEVSFRNALFDTGARMTAGRWTARAPEDCWLTSRPSFLEHSEEEEVREAETRLRTNRRRTAGHLIAQLSFGFWIRLCNAPYEHGRTNGPRLWPEAIKRFPNCPKTIRTRADIRAEFSELRDFRNRLAHHHPLWDQNPLGWHERLLRVLGWMNAELATCVAARSQVQAIVLGGHAAFRADAASSISVS